MTDALRMLTAEQIKEIILLNGYSHQDMCRAIEAAVLAALDAPVPEPTTMYAVLRAGPPLPHDFMPSKYLSVTKTYLDHYVNYLRIWMAENAAPSSATKKATRGDWILHNAGLVNTWAQAWSPESSVTLIRYLEMLVDAAIAQEGK